jgi:predicted DNA-binding WGR domain protein
MRHRDAGAIPAELPLFPDRVALTRIRPERNERRFYPREIWPDLFDHALLIRQWSRIGTEGRRRLDAHPDAGNLGVRRLNAQKLLAADSIAKSARFML